MDFDSLVPDNDALANENPQAQLAAEGAKPLVNAAKNVWDQGGQNIHNSLAQADQGDYSGLQNIAIQNAISTVGAKPSAEFIGYQEIGEGQHLPLFNIVGEGHPLNGSTVSPSTLAKHGIEVPQVPTFEQWNGSQAPATAAPLDMSEAARMARAKDMGFDTSKTYYHGTNDAPNFEEFIPSQGAYGKGIYFTDTPSVSDIYNGSSSIINQTSTPKGNRTIPAHLPTSKMFTYEDSLKGMQQAAKDLGYKDYSAFEDDRLGRAFYPEDNFNEILKEKGFLGKIVKNPIPQDDSGTLVQQLIMFDPKHIRSKFGAFDPSKSGSGNISFAEGGVVDFDSLQADQPTPDQNAPNFNSVGSAQNIPSFDDLQDDQDKYGTGSQQALAGLEGAAEGLAGPLAPAAELATGLTTPEAIRGRAEANPYIKGGSKLAGFAGSMATGFGEAALLGKAGEAVVGATNLSSKIGQAALRGATEMGLLGAGDEITKQIVQDPDASFQTAVADVGLSALLGAGGGAAFTAISPLWEGAFANKTGKMIEDFKGRVHQKLTNPEPLSSVAEELSEHYNNVKNVADDVYGPTGLKAMDIAKSMPEHHSGITVQMQDLNQNLSESLSKMSEKPYSYPERLTAKLQDDVRNWEKAISNPESTPTELFNATQDLKQTVQGYSKYGKFVAPHDEAYDFIKETKNIGYMLRESLEDESVWKNAAVRQREINKAFTTFKPSLEAFEKKFTTQVPGEGGMTRIIDPGKLQTYLNQVGKASGEVKQGVLKSFLNASEKYTETLAKSHQNLGLESPFSHSPLAATHETLQELTPGMKLADAVIKSTKEGAGPTIGASAGSMISHATGIPGGGLLGAILGEKVLSPWIKSVFPVIAKAMFEGSANSKALKAASEYGLSVIKGEALLTKGAKNVFKAGAEIIPISSIPSAKHREQLSKLVSKYQENPEALTEKANNSLGGYMPAQALAMGKTLGATAQYLADNNKRNGKQAPLDTMPPQSKAQQADKINALNIAEQPLLILSKVKDGTITPTDIHAIQSMYPDLYNKMQAKVSNELASHLDKGGIVPYKTRVGLSLFLGQAMDSTFLPGSIVAAQPVLNNSGSVPDSSASKVKRSTKPLTNYSQQYQTPGQAREMNRIKKG